MVLRNSGREKLKTRPLRLGCLLLGLFVALVFLVQPVPPSQAESPDESTHTSNLPAFADPSLQLLGQIGGFSHALDKQGDYAYLGVGRRLLILDVSDASNPRLLGQSQLVPAMIESVAVQGNYAYLAAGESGLHLFDVRDPAAPQRVGYLDPRGSMQDVVVAGTTAYLANTLGFYTVDIQDPTSPQQQDFYETEMPPEAVAVQDGRAYVVTSYQGILWNCPAMVDTKIRLLLANGPSARHTQLG